MENRTFDRLRTSLWLSLLLSCTALLVLLLLSEKDKARAFACEGADLAPTPEVGPPPAGGSSGASGSSSVDPKLRVLLRNLATPAGRVNPRAVRAIREFGSLAVPAILAEAGDGDDAYQEGLILCLGEIGDAAAIPPLLRRLGRPGDPLKDAVVKALSGLVSERTAPDILPLLDSEGTDVRVGALRVLKRIPTAEGTRSAVRILLEDPSADARAAALELLGDARDPSALEPLFLSLKDADKRIRVRTVQLLGRHADPGVREALKACFSDDPDLEVRRAAAEMLARL